MPSYYLNILDHKDVIYQKKLKIKTYKTVILPVVLYGCDTLSITLREEHKLRVFENRVLREILVPEKGEDGSWKNCIMMSFIACIFHLLSLGWLNQGKCGGRDMWQAWGRREEFTGFWLEGPKARHHWEDLGVGGRITLSWTLGR
jgi:hypothetical protein